MNRLNQCLLGLVLTTGLTACSKDDIEFGQGDIQIRIEPGTAYLHDFRTKIGLKIKNPPQIAVWMEDLDGQYLATVYVTKKIATQGWLEAKGNRRKEALPHWCHARGVPYEDGLYLPTKRHPLPDNISGATPRKGCVVKSDMESLPPRFIVKVEVNHSTDFNDSYPKEALPGDANYSGGREGSGQPALVYQAYVDLNVLIQPKSVQGKRHESSLQCPNRSQTSLEINEPCQRNVLDDSTAIEAVLIGHSSPDGSDGNLYTDMTGLTSALEILKRITIHIP